MALWNNFPYTNMHELNLDYLIDKMNELEKKIENMKSSVTATATQGSEAGVTVEGTVEEGLNFDFTLPPVTPATSNLAGIVKPDNDTTIVTSGGTLSSQVPAIVLTIEGTPAAGNNFPADTFTQLPFNATRVSSGSGNDFTISDNGVRVNRSGVYLIEGSSWGMAFNPTTATSIQLRAMKGRSYAAASAIGWGITNAVTDDPVNTAMRVVRLSAGDIIFLDIAVTGSEGLFKYQNHETQLTVVKLA